MRTYRSLSQADLQLSDSEWDELTAFVGDAQEQLAATDRTEEIESYPPKITAHSEHPQFDPGGWVGAYPGSVHVYPGKITQYEYRYLLNEVAGWFEIWDLPTAAAVLPMLNSRNLDSRSVVIGYSKALSTFTEEALAHRPPTVLSREPTVGSTLKGPLNVQRTVRTRARGTQQLAYDKLEFSLDHPLNLLLLRFHVELAHALDDLLSQSYVMTDLLRDHLSYHRQFLTDAFPDELLDTALDRDFTAPTLLDDTRQAAPQGLVELVDLWESYLADQTLSIDFSRQLTVGVKPIEKVYELWVLGLIVDILEAQLETEPTTVGDSIDAFDFGAHVTLYYDQALTEYSSILADGFDSHPGRPDYAIAVDDEIVWVGDAKFRHESNIGLESYQRFLSYMVDLIPVDAGPTGAIIYSGADRATPTTVDADMTITQLPLRPKHNTSQRIPIATQLESVLDAAIHQ